MHFRALDCTGSCDQGNILKIITSFLRAPSGCQAQKQGQSVPQRDGHDSVEFCEHQHHECSRFAASERSTILWVSLDMGLFLSLVIILSFITLCLPSEEKRIRTICVTNSDVRSIYIMGRDPYNRARNH